MVTVSKDLDVRGRKIGVSVPALRGELLHRRHALVEERLKHARETEGLLETHEPEVGDHATTEISITELGRAEERALQEISEIDAALARMDLGTYGVCSECHDPIDPRRLQAYPIGDRCADCA